MLGKNFTAKFAFGNRVVSGKLMRTGISQRSCRLQGWLQVPLQESAPGRHVWEQALDKMSGTAAGTQQNFLDIGLDKPASHTRIVVAMSGGVDSSVAAALLKEAGYDVIGVTLQLYDHSQATHRSGSCCAGQDIHDARIAAARLSIPHYVLDYEERFRERVILPFAESYAKGQTPVPCAICNSDVKFADLLATALDLGADALATGHYVRSRLDELGERALYRARDLARDQSYFLFSATKQQLNLLRFPLGELQKSSVRALARNFGLPAAEKPDSQDICFVPTGRYSDVVKRLWPDAIRPGDIVDVDGQVLGRHEGVFHYTVGQRRGLGLGGSPSGAPLFVIELDARNARVVVGSRQALAVQTIHLRGLNWIGPGSLDEIADNEEVFVRVRSTRPPVRGFLQRAPHSDSPMVRLAESEFGVSPGQACVLYDSAQPGARVLGGGFIASTTAAQLPSNGKPQRMAPLQA